MMVKRTTMKIKMKLGQIWIFLSVMSGGITFHVDCQDDITDLRVKARTIGQSASS